MASVNYDKLVNLLKKDDETNHGEAARHFNVTPGQLSMLLFCQAQVEAGVYKKAPATEASVKKLREQEGNRWELIAARTGQTVGGVKKMYEDAGGDVKAYVGRGRNWSADAKETPAPASRGRGKAATQTVEPPKRRGRPPKSAQTGTARGATPQRARTRAERAARTPNPS